MRDRDSSAFRAIAVTQPAQTGWDMASGGAALQDSLRLISAQQPPKGEETPRSLAPWRPCYGLFFHKQLGLRTMASAPFGLDPISFWIIVTGALVNVACGTIGCFLVLRRLSLVGDAISHAVLPGIAIAFLVGHSRDPWLMLLGALGAGMATVVITHVVERYAKVPEDAALGVAFTSLFALGVILIGFSASRVDLDPHCVLYGAIEFVPLDTIDVFGAAIPRVAVVLAVVTAGVLGFIALFWKELRITSFDPHLATTLGIDATVMHYLLMAVVAIVTVAAFEAVGSILVVAMLIVPGATAHLLSDRLSGVLGWAIGLAILTAVLGQWIGSGQWASDPAAVSTHIAGAMSVVAGLGFALAVVFAPRHGVVAKRVHRLRLALRIVCEDLLAILWRWRERGETRPLTRREIAALLGMRVWPTLAMWYLRHKRHIVRAEGGWHLAERSVDYARSLVHLHRLWETWINRHFGVPPERVHPSADRMMHVIPDELALLIHEDVGFAQTDPHGKPIPKFVPSKETGKLPPPPHDDATTNSDSARHQQRSSSRRSAPPPSA